MLRRTFLRGLLATASLSWAPLRATAPEPAEEDRYWGCFSYRCPEDAEHEILEHSDARTADMARQVEELKSSIGRACGVPREFLHPTDAQVRTAVERLLADDEVHRRMARLL